MAGRDFIPCLAMVLVQFGFAGLNIISKIAMDSGMNPFVLVTYRQIIATIFSAPFAYFWERKTRLKITWTILFQIFLCAFFGATANQLFYIMGLKYSTPTIACALNNLLPAITFILAIPFGMERIRIKMRAGQAKVFGTAICVGGAMLMTFYKGQKLNVWSPGVHFGFAKEINDESSSNGAQNVILGSVFIVVSCFAWAAWFILQARMSKTFSAPYSSSALMCFMASIQCATITVCVERDFSRWALGWNVRLLASVYTGVVCSGIAFSLMSWCIEKRGPLYVSMFSPLLLIIVAVIGWGVFNEKLYAGSVLGSVSIVGGLYAVLWGNGREFEEIIIANGKNSTAENVIEVVEVPISSNNNIDVSRQENGENEGYKETKKTQESSAVYAIDCSNFGT